MDERLRELTRDVIGDVRRIAARIAERAKRQTQATAATSAPAGGLAMAGVAVAVAGGLMLLATPVVPRRYRHVRWRLFGTAIFYLACGVAASTFGALGVRESLRRSGRQTRRDIERTATAIGQAVGELS